MTQAWNTLSSDQGGADGLGFKKSQPLDGGAPQRLKATQKRLRERGQELSEEQVALLQSMAEADQIRRRFWVQASLSFLVLGVCLALVWRGPGDESLQKALFALMGTVVGYWLR